MCVKNITVLVGGVLLSVNVWAHDLPPMHHCLRPLPPLSLGTKAEINRFNQSLDVYQECIRTFMEQQRRAAENHQRAATQAINDWNRLLKEKRHL